MDQAITAWDFPQTFRFPDKRLRFGSLSPQSVARIHETDNGFQSDEIITQDSGNNIKRHQVHLTAPFRAVFLHGLNSGLAPRA
jgi:hypothetical protein